MCASTSCDALVVIYEKSNDVCRSFSRSLIRTGRWDVMVS